MIINSVTSTPADYLVVRQETDNIAAVNAQIARDAEARAANNARLNAEDAERLDTQRMREALNRRIDQDVQAGIISESDAAAVRKTLDEIDAQNQTDAANQANGQSADGPAARTVLTENVTFSGPIKTKVTVYSDGTSETTTTVATPADALRYDQQVNNDTSDNAIAMQYLATIEAGTLFTQLA